jgi:hypothetical protein
VVFGATFALVLVRVVAGFFAVAAEVLEVAMITTFLNKFVSARVQDSDRNSHLCSGIPKIFLLEFPCLRQVILHTSGRRLCLIFVKARRFLPDKIVPAPIG